MNDEKTRESLRKLAAYAAELGICRRCQKKAAVPHKSQCERCTEIGRKAMRKYYRKKVEESGKKLTKPRYPS